MATNGESKEDSLQPPADRNDEPMVCQEAVRREQPEALFLHPDRQQLVERTAVTERRRERPRRMPHGHRNEHHLPVPQHGKDGIRVKPAQDRRDNPGSSKVDGSAIRSDVFRRLSARERSFPS